MVRNMFNGEDIRNLTGKILLSTPIIASEYLSKTMVYICKHDEEGAIGVIINKPIPNLNAHAILKSLKVEVEGVDDINLRFGGLESVDKCFILHSDDFVEENSICITKDISLTVESDIIRALAFGRQNKVICIGCCVWSAQQLEEEVISGYWIPIKHDAALIFGDVSIDKWKKGLLKIGSNSSIILKYSGNA